MIIDCHVHACAATPGHGSLSERLLRQWSTRFMRWRLGITAPYGEPLERQAEARLVETVNGVELLDRAVVLALDAVHDRDGRLNVANTHFHVTNDYAWESVPATPQAAVRRLGPPLPQGRGGRAGTLCGTRGGARQVAADRAGLRPGGRTLPAVLRGPGPAPAAAALSHRRRAVLAQPEPLRG